MTRQRHAHTHEGQMAHAPRPQFVKVFVRIVDWDAATQHVESSTPSSLASQPYEHPSWRDAFTVVDLPAAVSDPGFGPTVDTLSTIAVCRWGRSVLSYTWLFLADRNGRRVSWSAESATDSTDHAASSSSIDNRNAIAVHENTPLSPETLISSLPVIELPQSFVLMTRPSRFVSDGVVRHVLQSMQDLVVALFDGPRSLMREMRDRRAELIAVRASNVAGLEEAKKRSEVRAVLLSHQREDARLVAMSQQACGATTNAKQRSL